MLKNHNINVLKDLHHNKNMSYTDISSLLESVFLARAALLARKGKLRQAEEMISPIVDEKCINIGAIDLLAKIYAQQGKIEKAKYLWNRALEIDPSNPDYLRAIQRCSHFNESGLHSFLNTLKSLLTALLPIIAITFILIIGMQTREQLQKLIGQMQTMDSQATGIEDLVKNLEKNISSVSSDLKEIQTSLIVVPDPDLRTAVKRALQSHKGTNWLFLTITQDASTVCIAGKVPTLFTRYLVETVATSVPGIKYIDLSGLILSHAYKVQSGDTLWSIAVKVYGDSNQWDILAEKNHLSSPYLLDVGQELIIP